MCMKLPRTRAAACADLPPCCRKWAEIQIAGGEVPVEYDPASRVLSTCMLEDPDC
jgi:hypothetical protein